jgi:hypothetical protein
MSTYELGSISKAYTEHKDRNLHQMIKERLWMDLGREAEGRI